MVRDLVKQVYRGIDGIMVVQDAFMDLFTNVFQLCVTSSPNLGRDLYDATKALIEEQLQEVASRILEIEDHLQFLKEYAAAWDQFKLSTKVAHLAYNAMNTQWVKSQRQNTLRNANKGDVYVLEIMAYMSWKRALLDPVKEKVQGAVFQLIANERNGESVETLTIRSAINSYLELGKVSDVKHEQLNVYREEFEGHFIEDTREFYRAETAGQLAAISMSDYLKHVERRLDEEEERARTYLDSSSHEAHNRAVNDTLIAAHEQALTDECPRFVIERRIADLGRMFRLFERIDKLQPLLDAFGQHVTECGRARFVELEPASRDPAQRAAFPATYCRAFLDIYAEFDAVVADAFKRHPRFVAALDRVAKQLLNDNAIHKRASEKQYSALHAARYAHALLIDRAETAESVAPKLRGVARMYSFLEAKDAFQRYYKQGFRSRLLEKLSTSRDAEQRAITELKAVAQYAFVNELNVMIRDLERSKEDSIDFPKVAVAPTGCDKAPEIDAVVVTRASWPIDTVELGLEIQMPPEIADLADQSQRYYSKKYNNRSLIWLHERSKAVIDTAWLTTAYRITVNHFQLGVLLAFNSVSGTTTYAELKSALGIEDTYLAATLDSLTGIRLLQRNPAKGDYADTTALRLNPKFKGPRRVLDASVRWHRPVTGNEDAEDARIIRETRDLNTQAAIVRIMKARKTLDHAQLIQEVSNQTKKFFPTDVGRIKRQIEKLINSTPAFLERISAREYRYLA
jgi:cullin 1